MDFEKMCDLHEIPFAPEPKWNECFVMGFPGVGGVKGRGGGL